MYSSSISAWHARYEHAGKLYQQVGPFSPQLFDALAAGFREWARELPYVDHDGDGKYLPANSWGLGAELHSMDMIRLMLELDGRERIADELRYVARNIYETARHIDALQPKQSQDGSHAETRLVLTARNQAEVIACMLCHLKRQMFCAERQLGDDEAAPPPGAAKPLAMRTGTRRRASRTAALEALKQEVIEHIRSAGDKAWTDCDMGREPTLLPCPTRNELGRRAGLPSYAVSRCFNDRHAKELRTLYTMADNLEMVMKYTHR